MFSGGTSWCLGDQLLRWCACEACGLGFMVIEWINGVVVSSSFRDSSYLIRRYIRLLLPSPSSYLYFIPLEHTKDLVALRNLGDLPGRAIPRWRNLRIVSLAFQSAPLHSTALRYISFHYAPFHLTPFHFISLRFVSLHSLPCKANVKVPRAESPSPAGRWKEEERTRPHIPHDPRVKDHCKTRPSRALSPIFLVVADPLGATLSRQQSRSRPAFGRGTPSRRVLVAMGVGVAFLSRRLKAICLYLSHLVLHLASHYRHSVVHLGLQFGISFLLGLERLAEFFNRLLQGRSLFLGLSSPLLHLNPSFLSDSLHFFLLHCLLLVLHHPSFSCLAKVLQREVMPTSDDAGKGAQVGALSGELHVEAPVEEPCG
ncbi:hypothetical protein Taro_031551 [Colocasia esculenta]|uniref:Uncharacterized protein n=1 Tax=Colocasia esculenta TaxID=4460 RepID=A0A843VS94_COLES|nr:hypothetical protein [Colocasia esculenta]